MTARDRGGDEVTLKEKAGPEIGVALGLFPWAGGEGKGKLSISYPRLSGLLLLNPSKKRV